VTLLLLIGWIGARTLAKVWKYDDFGYFVFWKALEWLFAIYLIINIISKLIKKG